MSTDRPQGEVCAVAVVHSERDMQELQRLLLPSWPAAAAGVRAALYIVLNRPELRLDPALCATSGLTVLTNPRRRGYADNINLGLAHADGFRYFLALNPDIRLAEGNLAAMVAFMDRHDDCGMSTCKLFGLTGDLQANCRRWQSLGVILARRLKSFPRREPIIRRYLMLDEAYDRECTPDWVSGCYMFFDRALLQRVGGMDDRFDLYCEDCDIARRIWNAGRAVRFTPETYAYHREHRQSVSPFSWHFRTHLRSWLRFCYKRLFVYPRMPILSPAHGTEGSVSAGALQ